MEDRNLNDGREYVWLWRTMKTTGGIKGWNVSRGFNIHCRRCELYKGTFNSAAREMAIEQSKELAKEVFVRDIIISVFGLQYK